MLTDVKTGQPLTSRCMNLGRCLCSVASLLGLPMHTGGRLTKGARCSYNYLGFAAHDEFCTPRVKQCMAREGWSMCSPRGQAGAETH